MSNDSITSPTSSKYLQEVKEDHDNIEVENEGTDDIVINAQLVPFASHDQLGIEDEVDSKQEHSKSGKHHLENVVVEKQSEETQNKEGHSEDKDNTPFSSEVSLCGACISSAGSCYGNCPNGGTDDWLAVLEVIGAIVAIFVTSDLKC